MRQLLLAALAVLLCSIEVSWGSILGGSDVGQNNEDFSRSFIAIPPKPTQSHSETTPSGLRQGSNVLHTTSAVVTAGGKDMEDLVQNRPADYQVREDHLKNHISDANELEYFTVHDSKKAQGAGVDHRLVSNSIPEFPPSGLMSSDGDIITMNHNQLSEMETFSIKTPEHVMEVMPRDSADVVWDSASLLGLENIDEDPRKDETLFEDDHLRVDFSYEGNGKEGDHFRIIRRPGAFHEAYDAQQNTSKELSRIKTVNDEYSLPRIRTTPSGAGDYHTVGQNHRDDSFRNTDHSYLNNPEGRVKSVYKGRVLPKEQPDRQMNRPNSKAHTSVTHSKLEQNHETPNNGYLQDSEYPDYNTPNILSNLPNSAYSMINYNANRTPELGLTTEEHSKDYKPASPILALRNTYSEDDSNGHSLEQDIVVPGTNHMRPSEPGPGVLSWTNRKVPEFVQTDRLPDVSILSDIDDTNGALHEYRKRAAGMVPTIATESSVQSNEDHYDKHLYKTAGNIPSSHRESSMYRPAMPHAYTDDDNMNRYPPQPANIYHAGYTEQPYSSNLYNTSSDSKVDAQKYNGAPGRGLQHAQWTTTRSPVEVEQNQVNMNSQALSYLNQMSPNHRGPFHSTITSVAESLARDYLPTSPTTGGHHGQTQGVLGSLSSKDRQRLEEILLRNNQFTLLDKLQLDSYSGSVPNVLSQFSYPQNQPEDYENNDLHPKNQGRHHVGHNGYGSDPTHYPRIPPQHEAHSPFLFDSHGARPTPHSFHSGIGSQPDFDAFSNTVDPHNVREHHRPLFDKYPYQAHTNPRLPILSELNSYEDNHHTGRLEGVEEHSPQQPPTFLPTHLPYSYKDHDAFNAEKLENIPPTYAVAHETKPYEGVSGDEDHRSFDEGINELHSDHQLRSPHKEQEYRPAYFTPSSPSADPLHTLRSGVTHIPSEFPVTYPADSGYHLLGYNDHAGYHNGQAVAMQGFTQPVKPMYFSAKTPSYGPTVTSSGKRIKVPRFPTSGHRHPNVNDINHPDGKEDFPVNSYGPEVSDFSAPRPYGKYHSDHIGHMVGGTRMPPRPHGSGHFSSKHRSYIEKKFPPSQEFTYQLPAQHRSVLRKPAFFRNVRPNREGEQAAHSSDQAPIDE